MYGKKETEEISRSPEETRRGVKDSIPSGSVAGIGARWICGGRTARRYPIIKLGSRTIANYCTQRIGEVRQESKIHRPMKNAPRYFRGRSLCGRVAEWQGSRLIIGSPGPAFSRQRSRRGFDPHSCRIIFDLSWFSLFRFLHVRRDPVLPSSYQVLTSVFRQFSPVLQQPQWI